MRFVPAPLLLTMLLPCLLGAVDGDTYESTVVPLLQKYCHDCHGAERPKGGVDLASIFASGQMVHQPDTWVNVARVVRDQTMPPSGKTQPTQEERDTLVAVLNRTLETLDYPLDPGRTVVRRLTRVEYNHTVRDLLGATSNPADRFPSDAGGGEGFDNNAATLYVTPILLEQYLLAARHTAEQASADRIFIARPDATTSSRVAGEKIVRHFLPRAFRRPVTQEEVGCYTELLDDAVARGESFEKAARLMVRAVLVSPNFLYRMEKEPARADAPYVVGDYELATRLSYFLWSSMPDDELFEAARQGRLRDDAHLTQQVRRMIADPKSRALAERFAGQWLDIHRIHDAERDSNRFPAFTPQLRAAMHEEAVLFFDSVIRDNAPLLDLINADYVYVNEPLAKHYGIAEVTGPQFRRVELDDPNRGGVLTLGAVLTLTSYPQRTSPVLRGKWLLEQVLGHPSPPPPMNVKTLPPDDQPREGLTFRQRLEQHRKDPTCASCHDRLDPLGFALENFDAIGAWRDQIGGAPVDAAGQLTSGRTFTGPAELKTVVIENHQDFIRNLTRKMLGYALGRGVEPADTPAVLRIMKSLKADGYRGQTLVTEIVTGYPFRHRRNASPPATQTAQE